MTSSIPSRWALRSGQIDLPDRRPCTLQALDGGRQARPAAPVRMQEAKRNALRASGAGWLAAGARPCVLCRPGRAPAGHGRRDGRTGRRHGHALPLERLPQSAQVTAWPPTAWQHVLQWGWDNKLCNKEPPPGLVSDSCSLYCCVVPAASPRLYCTEPRAAPVPHAGVKASHRRRRGRRRQRRAVQLSAGPLVSRHIKVVGAGQAARAQRGAAAATGRRVGGAADVLQRPWRSSPPTPRAGNRPPYPPVLQL